MIVTDIAACWLLLSLQINSAYSALLQARQTETPVTDAPSPTSASQTSPSSDTPEITSSLQSNPPNNSPSPKPAVQYPTCHSLTGPLVPFCLPDNSSEVWVSNTYYVTWDSDFFPRNSTITIEINYANASDPSGPNAYSSPKVENQFGHMTVEMQKEWLRGQSSNNLTFYIVDFDPTTDQKPTVVKGPTVKLTTKPADHYDPPPPTPVPDRLGLFIGLPLGVALFVVIMGGLMFGMRKHRSIGLGNVMGRSGRGYLRIGTTGAGSCRRGQNTIPLERYKDDPHRGTLSDLFEVDQDSRRVPSDVFREDVRSMKNWKN